MIALLFLLAAQDPEIELRAGVVAPKFRLRDGEKSLKGESVFSKELDAEDDVFSPGGEAAVRWKEERFHVAYASLTVEGDGTLDEAKAWGGSVVPAGTVSDAEVFFQHVELGWSHRFALQDERVWLDAGVAVEWMVVDAELGFGSTRLGGVFPTPQLDVSVKPFHAGWLEVSGGIGGFFLPFRSGDTSCLDPIEYRFEVKGRWDRFAVSLGYELYHIHLEENANHVDEDVVHLRLRGWFLSVEVRI